MSKLLPLTFQPLPLGAIRPAGWLERQLRIQANGLTGTLHEFWPDIRDSGWIGGDAEGWERCPYWLDGLVPLAFQLGDERLLGVARRYVGHILDHQQESGFLGPHKHRPHEDQDVWPLFIVFKVLTQWHEATGEPRALTALQRGLKAMIDVLPKRPLRDWGKSRWGDLVVSAQWLFDRTGEAWLLELSALAAAQGYDWRSHFSAFQFFDRQTCAFSQFTHVVNNAMAVKTPAVWYRQSHDDGDRRSVAHLLETLDRYHGQATGLFTGDEHYAGLNPSQGTETCAVVEYMYSLEVLMSVLGEPALADRLERIAFNALPAPFTDDMVARQYDQQANQVLIRSHEDRPFATNGASAHCFGLETNFGCCTADMHQGWPKFVSHLWMKTPDGGLAAVSYAPCTVQTQLGDAAVKLQVQTDYPFGSEIALHVETDRPAKFPLLLRVPMWTRGATIDGQSVQGGTYHRIDRTWSGRTKIEMKFPAQPRLERRFNNAAAIHYGPLVLTLPVGTYWKAGGGIEGHPDYQLFPTTPWNYALDVSGATIESDVQVTPGKPGEVPFGIDHPPLTAKVRGRRVPEWVLLHNAADVPPPSPAASDQPLEELTLVPYGCPKLRVTEMPTLR
ncbi:MAG: beta-L-arabinofuranosidase domain-containing protein [Planctomycetaceae bacterium]|nr:glycoside hydrolase family 127 protein [Planctomycetaceae bacterium]